jgi:23S rRNA pseudouridine1911/1915/1917 synthase
MKLIQQIEVLYEDNHLIAVNKKPSQIVQEDKTGDKPLIEFVKDYIKVKYNKPGEVFLGVVHRIDRPVSGVVIFARTSKAQARLNEMLKTHEINKTYIAIVKNKPEIESDKLSNYILRNTKQNKSYIYQKEVKDSQFAELNYKLIGSSDNYHLLEIELITGRHHQIRAQLSAIGCPIKGDLKYGAPRSNEDASICLHSYKMEFLHPIKKEQIIITAPPPQNSLWNYFLKYLIKE